MQSTKLRKIECHDCALPVTIPELQHMQKAICPRCGLKLTVYYRANLDYIVAFALTTLVFLIATLPFPFLSFSARGQSQQMDLIQGLHTLIDHDFLMLAIVQGIAIFIIPLVILGSLFYLLLPIILGKNPPPAKEQIVSLVFMLLPWSMAEIFLIGTLVSLIKMSTIADLSLGLSFYAYIAFSVCMVLTVSYLDKVALYEALGIDKPHTRPTNPQSQQFTWALLMTSIILYIPASVMPIMTTRFLGRDDPNTIMQGVILLWQHDSYLVAMVIFVASVFIPIAKIITLSWLNYSVHIKSHAYNQQRMLLYRMTEFVGRWSMIDVFVVIILVSLVQLGNTMSIVPGPAALAFSALVIMTMLAAMSFDPQLIWQPEKNDV